MISLMSKHSQEEIRAAAQRIANEHLEDCEFSNVYEDEWVENWTEDEWRDVHQLITHSRVVLPE